MGYNMKTIKVFGKRFIMTATMEQLDNAILLATQAHWGQLDKAGAPYILHPMRVMMRMPTIEGKIVAIGHDLIEDTDVTVKDLVHADWPERCIMAIDCITKCPNETYNEYLDRVISDILASECKLEDMRDNSNIYRLQKVAKHHLNMIAKYHKGALRILEVYPEFSSRFELIT